MGGHYKLSKESSWSYIALRICIGIVLKFMLGSDDLVWLAPFMARARTVPQKVDIGIKYVSSVLFLTLLACALAAVIHMVAHSGSGDELVDECIATVAACLLFAYAMHMARDEGYFSKLCHQEQPAVAEADEAAKSDETLKKEANEVGDYGTVPLQQGEEEELGPIKAAVKNTLLCMSDTFDAYCSCVDADTRELSKDLEDESDTSVVIVAFLGSMDDFMVYFTLALSHELTWFELAAGVTIGGILIALIVGALLQSSETLAHAVESVPVPLILIGLSALILISAWTDFDGF